MPYFLGVDVSTTATKALLIDGEGAVVGHATQGYSFETPRPAWAEQSPQTWWEAAVHSISSVLEDRNVEPEEVEAVGLTGQMHSLVLLDDSGGVLRPSILWNDQRSSPQCEKIHREVGEERLLRITGNRAHPGFTAPKILWVRDEEPSVYQQIAHVLLPKDYLRFRLSGKLATDKAGAAGTLLFDQAQRDWSRELMDALDLSYDWFPPTFEGPEVTGTITARAAGATGLPEGTPVVAGGGDQSVQAIGVGAIKEGRTALTLGTSGVVFSPTEDPVWDPEGRLHAFCHAVPDRWHLMGVMLSAAGSLQWFRDALAPTTSFDELLEPVHEVPAGSEGLLFLPYLTGERTPHPDPDARGAFLGLTIRHRRAHMTRAILEGVGFGLREGLDLLEWTGPAIEQIRLSGGGTRSGVWRQILADILQRELHRVDVMEGASFGAAILAGVGAGYWPSVEQACSEVVRTTGTISPRSERTEPYDRIFQLYKEQYARMRETFEDLSDLSAM